MTVISEPLLLYSQQIAPGQRPAAPLVRALWSCMEQLTHPRPVTGMSSVRSNGAQSGVCSQCRQR
ncbi:MAG: hypothetical protein NZM00_14465, partial [Anaerolinea sp.]|nr:hypothetical protein [Anaerolinea sp.]